MTTTAPPPLQRFWKYATPGSPSECWEWRGGRNRGYGAFSSSGRLVGAHRWLYQELRGALPVGVQLDHLCSNQSCVHPAPLEPVTRKENILRGICPSAENARKQNCKAGHPLSGPNLRIRHTKRGAERFCVACSKERDRRYRPRTKPPNRERTHCPAGHPYSGENLLVYGNRRHCRACRASRNASRRKAA